MRVILVNILFVLFSTPFLSSAQNVSKHTVSKEPNLFDKYPTEIHISSAQVLALIDGKLNDSVAIHSADGSAFKGHIKQKNIFSADAQTISVELKGFPAGTMLIVNKINKDGKIIYRAQILNHKNPDAYVLKTFDGNEFIFVKTEKEKIVTE